ncbi:MAG: hypothetical protein ACFCUU_16415 [Cyclobacteriaceae bacterium]
MFAGCEDPPFRPYQGFTKREAERLIHADTAKFWVLDRRWIDGRESELEPCDLNSFWIFSRAAGAVTSTTNHPIYLAYNPAECNPNIICQNRPSICAAHEIFCEADSAGCVELNANAILSAGTWRVQEPFIQNGPAEFLQWNFPADTFAMNLVNISSVMLRLSYQARVDNENVTITELYKIFETEEN